VLQRLARERTYERGVGYRASAGEVGEGVSLKLSPSILLTFHSEFDEFDLFARNVEIGVGLYKEVNWVLSVHKEAEE
tara:strand:- start:169 stop:399 length:231 start_codon:yes stop_codon:yes gene_type:complete